MSNSEPDKFSVPRLRPKLRTWAEDSGASRPAGRAERATQFAESAGDFARPESAEAESPEWDGGGDAGAFRGQRARKARRRATSRSPGRPSRPPPLARRPPAGAGFEPAEPRAGGSAAAERRGPGAGGCGPAGRPARGVPGGRGAPAAPPAPRGDPGPPPASPPARAGTRRPGPSGRAGGRTGGRAGDGTKAPLLSGGRRRVTHNGGGSRLRRRRRARRGALPRRPASAPRTRTHTHTHSRDFSGSSRECGARGQPPVSAQVSGCAGGSGVSEALALPQSPPCNPDPRERAREKGAGLSRATPLRVTGSLHGFPRPRPAPSACTRRNFQR